jgi:hypothetical protein
VADVDDALVRLRTVLRDYRDSLTQRHPRVEVSPLEALRTLATIASMTPQPSAATRFDIATLQSLGTRRAEAAQALATAARLGEFRFGPDDSPWYGVAFASTQEARDTHALAGRLHRTEVPAMLERGYELIAQTRMRPFSTLAELGAYVQLLQGIRASLDRFSTTVFERPLAELIQAHAPRRDAPAMTSPQRRRLKNLSREYVRPGMHITDMHESLVRVQQQRAQWQQLVDPGVMPEIPLGLDDVATAWQRVAADLGRSIAHWGAPNRSRRCRFPTCCALSRPGGDLRRLRQPGRTCPCAANSPMGLEELTELSSATFPKSTSPPSSSSRGGSPLSSDAALGPGAARREHVGRRPARTRLPPGRRGARRLGGSAAGGGAGDDVEDRRRRRGRRAAP